MNTLFARLLKHCANLARVTSAKPVHVMRLLLPVLLLSAAVAQAAGVVQSVHRDYDALGRLWKVTYPDQRVIEYGYDANGNRKTMTETLSNNLPAATTRTTFYSYDALNRLETITDPDNGITTFKYDGRDNTVEVKDPRNLITSYTYNGFDELIKQVSPDTGTSNFDWKTDPGVLKTATDARLKNITTSYDGQGRPLLRDEGLEKVSYTWDTAVNGQGQLHIIQRTRGSTLTLTETHGYDALGRLTTMTQNILSTSPAVNFTRIVRYGYNSKGQLETVTYPSNTSARPAVVTYGYDTQGRISGVKFNGADLIRNIIWAPFGDIKGWTWGNGLVHSRSYDLSGRLDLLAHGTLLQKDLDWDLGGRISKNADAVASRTQTYQYDKLDRLRHATYGTNVDDYTYDADGNRRTSQWDSAASTYNYPTSSNRLQSISGARTASYQYYANGSIQNDGSYSYTYNDGGRLTTATRLSNAAVTSYFYNGFGERIVKTGDSSVGSWAYVYDTDGHLLGEYSLDGSFQEHLWLGDIPIGNLRSGSTTPLYVLADHLNTPRMLVNGASSPGTAVWGWQGDPFGSKPATTSPGFVYNLRFPGQYYDAETGKHYNYFRDYDPLLGRYLQSDPIGLKGGVNTYGYVEANPIFYADPEGLSPGTNATYRHAWGAQSLTRPTMMDQWLYGRGSAWSGQRAPNCPPKVVVSASRFPESAKHVKDAQAAGFPSNLTIDRAGASQNRRDATSSTPTKAGHDRDEYPPAMFKEGGAGASVRHVPSSDNKGSGACIGAQCRGLPDGTVVTVKVGP